MNKRWKQWKRRSRSGTTLVEMIVTLMLIGIMMVMAAGALSSASRIFVRIQQTQYAQSIIDTVMTELQTITENATVYVKIYEKGDSNIANKSGNSTGNALEFINEEGYVVLVSDKGCDATKLLINGQETGTTEAVPTGQLLTRYYTRDTTVGTRTYYYSQGTSTLIARAVAPVYGSKFYMGNYLEIIYTLPQDKGDGDVIPSITATVTLYRDAACTDAVATDSEILEFRHEVKCEMGQTATVQTSE